MSSDGISGKIEGTTSHSLRKEGDSGDEILIPAVSFTGDRPVVMLGGA